MYKGLMLPIPKRYERLVLVGHSLGAVIIRAAVLDIAQNELTRVKNHPLIGGMLYIRA
jgi:alpha-beta hydrolase superfamily lysophospholipase